MSRVFSVSPFGFTLPIDVSYKVQEMRRQQVASSTRQTSEVNWTVYRSSHFEIKFVQWFHPLFNISLRYRRNVGFEVRAQYVVAFSGRF